MRICTYDDGSVVQLDEGGPCEDVLSSGAYLTDDVTEAEGGIVRVVPEFGGFAVLGLAVAAAILFGGFNVSRRR